MRAAASWGSLWNQTSSLSSSTRSLDASGNPEKDANGRFIKGDLIAYTVMEKRTGWGKEYPDDIRNGEWEYQAFKADKTVNGKANLKNCFTCHKPLAQQDFVFSFEAMKNAK